MLLLTPSEGVARVLAAAAVEAEARGTVEAISEAIAEGAGCAVLPLAALDGPALGVLAATLARQPAWSDLPLVVLTQGEAPEGVVSEVLERLGNATLLDWPASATTLVSVVRANLRARDRQYQLRARLVERDAHIRRLEETQERLDLAAQAAKLGMWEYDIEGDALRTSPHFRKLLSLGEGDRPLSLEAFLATVHAEDRELIRSVLGTARATGSFEVDYRVVTIDGSTHWLSARGVARRDARGRPIGVLGVAMDITDRKAAEQEIQKANAALRRSNDDLHQFAYAASHDLREPMRIVSMYTDLLARRYADRLDEEGRKYIDFAGSAARRMTALLQALLDYSRADADTSPASGPVSADAALDIALLNLQPAIAETGGRVTRGRLPRVAMQELHLAQVFQNLIANALRYRGEAPPRVHVSARRQPGEWVFSVRDEGIGIDPRFHGQIFGLFRRLDDRSQGAGIGLAICAKIVGRYGGRIWVDSKPGQGATFRFTVPAT